MQQVDAEPLHKKQYLRLVWIELQQKKEQH